jgi:CRP-like cAMP-binding protein
MAIEQALLLNNTLLQQLPADELKRLAGAGELVVLAQQRVLAEFGADQEAIWFPLDCLVAQFAVGDGGLTLEVGLTGHEGAVGAAAALGRTSAATRAVVQQEGRAVRVARDQLLRLLGKTPVLQRALLAQADALLAQAVQTAVCSRYHILEERLARVLLTTRDRLGSPTFHMTHEFLAQALGVRRVGVTKAATLLQGMGLIGYSRGAIRILDGGGLERAACSCYRVLRSPGT